MLPCLDVSIILFVLRDVYMENKIPTSQLLQKQPITL